MKGTALERFIAKVDFTDTCWLWKASQDTDEYGQFWYCEKVMPAHRASYLLFVGPIGDGLDIDHLCSIRPCVYPEHLEAVTRQENNRRAGLQGPCLENSQKTYCKNGHPFTEANTQIYGPGWRHCRECGRQANRRQYQRRKQEAQV